MTLINRINELNAEEIIELDNLINDFTDKFSSNSQSSTRIDFQSLLTSKRITMRILCKLSEWCNVDAPQYRSGKELASRISTILFGTIVPKIDSYEILIDNDKISIINA
jgi:hypothetical protein